MSLRQSEAQEIYALVTLKFSLHPSELKLQIFTFLFEKENAQQIENCISKHFSLELLVIRIFKS